MKSAYLLVIAIIVSLSTLNSGNSFCLAQEPYKLGVQENVQGQPSTYQSYPTPQMIPVPGRPAARAPVNNPKRSLQGSASSNNNQVSPDTFSTNITAVALPPAFLGAWQVHGQRTEVNAMPEFQAAAEQSFSINNDQIWNISGSQANGYTLGSNTGVTTALIIDQVQGNTAWLRYQHPVGNTMAQEAVVMRLAPGGRQFDGLEQISIVKQGLPQPRAKVKYHLTGSR